MAADRLETIVSLAKRRGFVYPSSEIYGGLRAAWDYGPLGVELKNNVKRQWWKSMVQGREDVVGLDSSVILAREVWQASGHVETFSDPLTECTECHKRYRADHLLEEAGVDVKNMTVADMGKKMLELKMKSPDGNPLSEPKVFNLLVEAGIGAVGEITNSKRCVAVVATRRISGI